MSKLLHRVTLVAPDHPLHEEVVDVRFSDGKLTDLAAQLVPRSGEESVDGKGQYLTRNFTDVGTLIGDPGFEQREDLTSLTAAAWRGGYGRILPFPNTHPAVDGKSGVGYLRRAAPDLGIELYPIGALTEDAAGRDLTEMIDMHRAGAVAFSDGTRSVQDAGLMMRCLQYVRAFDGMVINHPHSTQLALGGQMHEGTISTMLGMRGIPALAEEMMVRRDLELLRYTDSRLHIFNLSTTTSVDLVRQAKAEGLRVSCSAAVFNLLFTDHDLLDFNTQLKVLPPLRPADDVAALKRGLADGTIDFLTSNHRPYEDELKDLEFSNAEFGCTSLETAFSVALAALREQLSVPAILEKFNGRVNSIFGLPERSVGGSASSDWLLVDASAGWDYLHTESRSRNSPLLGAHLVGSVQSVDSFFVQ